MIKRRVKITGIGPVTPAGIGNDRFWPGILEPVSRVGPFKRLDPEAGPFVAAEVVGFDIEQYFSDISFRRLPRHTQFALAAAKLAIADAKIPMQLLGESDTAVMVGASLMDFEYTAKTITNVLKKGPRAAVPKAVFNAPVSAISSAIAHLIGGRARTLAVQSSCCSGTDSIGHAAALVASGEVDIAICGGTEAPLLQCPMIELRMVGLAPSTDENASAVGRPFDRWRTTGVIGEGACVLILEPEDSPRPGYAYVDGYSYFSDGDSGKGTGLHHAIKMALANAEVRPSQIDHVCAWGPGHRVIDAIEAGVLRKVFGDGLSEISVTSIKGAVGNPLGAAGAMQAATSALALVHQRIPPTVNWRFPDPACALALSGMPRDLKISKVLINSHGLSGTNAALVLSGE